MQADSVSLDGHFQLQQALALHQRYFETVDAVVATLMAPDEPEALADALAILADACKCSMAYVFLDEPDHASARPVCHWINPDSSLPKSIPESLRHIAYDQLPILAETLQVGMVLNKSLLEMSEEGQNLFILLGARRLICLPLLERDQSFGFLCLLDIRVEVARSSAELHFLAMLANVFAQALLKQRAEAEIQANQQRLRALVGATQDMVFELDESSVIVQVWSGHPALPPASSLIGKTLVQALPPSMADELLRALPGVVGEVRSVQLNVVVESSSGPVYLLIRLSPVLSGERPHAVAMVQDVTEIMQDAARRKTMLDTLNLLEDAVIDLTSAGELTETTPAWARLRGIDPRDIVNDLGQPLLNWVHPDDRDALADALSSLLDSETSKTQRFRLLRNHADTIWIEARLIAHYSPDGAVGGLRGVLRDVTVAHLNEQHITQLALYDTLTRLPNRLLLDDELHQSIDRARRKNSKVALGFIDLDHFKEVNDAFGHKTGDELLVNVANRLSAVLRDNDMLARWGGDEFIALIPDLTDLSELRVLAESLRNAAQQGVMLEGLEARPTISVGFAVYPEDASSAEELLSAADHTMYHAKNAGRNNVAFYSDIMHFKAFGREHMAIQTRLSNAIHDNSLQVFFQPVVDGGSGAVLALEALARWPDGQGGWISPDIFIPMAEKAGLIQDLSDRIMEQSFSRLASWRAAGLHQQLMLNISRSQLFSASFVTVLQDRLLQFNLRPQDIILEITESVALTDYARQLKHLRQIVAAGFQVAIDDFGTGYSSLSQLHEMPVQFLKVDGSFAQRLHTEDGRGVMQAIVQLGQLLKLNVIVEGIENQETARFLHQIGVRSMQGFYFSEAVPPNVAELMLRLGVTSHLNTRQTLL